MRIEAYHGTPFTFSTFRVPASGLHFGTRDQAAHACTIKLASLSPAAFARLEPDSSGWRGRLIKVRLHVQNPKRVQDAKTAAAWRRAIKAAKAEGHDALVYHNGYEGREAADSYVIFNAKHVEIINPRCNALQPAA